ncbi:hypothetical protein D9758_011319 [Tetrapyrgos nigripes]|uniref:Helicase ATP-binding domain-containing protein n=1 Tax=Tetrapyrgos nigripes TaxID=182062 RepID=A0A8H5LK96_9AGAR|nr:hypothetical protein D9758_011319 [Tetrapyrgos nigripes]
MFVFLPPRPSTGSIIVTLVIWSARSSMRLMQMVNAPKPLDSEGVLSNVAFATTEMVCILDAKPDSGCTNAPSTSASGALPLDNLFKQLLAGKDSRSVLLAGFDMPRLALRLFVHFGYHVKGTDLSTVCSPSQTEAWLPAKVVEAKIGIIECMDTFRINRLWHENNDNEENLCLRARLSASLARVCRSEIESVKKVDTRNVRRDILKCLGKLLKQTDILSRSLPKEMLSEYDNFDHKGGDAGFKLTNARYKTRVRTSKQAIVLLTDERGKEYAGRASSLKGKTTNIKFGAGQQPTQARAIQNIRVVGQDDPTNSERARNALLLKVLQGGVNLINYPFVRLLWLPTKEDVLELNLEDESWTEEELRLKEFVVNLNSSQRRVLRAMVASRPKMVIVHGPPGTGKTTVIASAAAYWSSFRLPVWIIGHSNVSVKNIAEKLWKQKVPFKIIVSKEFYFEWHEHIYKGITSNVIRGDEMPKDRVAMERLLQGAQVILSTLGMLSNPALDDNGTFRLVPVERLVIDEASQINVFEYLRVSDNDLVKSGPLIHQSIFYKFSNLEKVCFFGDPKQLPPFGQENAKSLQCIFNVKHLQSKSYFLDTQYRMPTVLGSFISQTVYDSQLKSEHKLKDLSCVSFIDAAMGKEEKSGSSWMNQEEIGCVVNLVRHYYAGKDFCVITPYDAQRSGIERALKAEKLPWDKVFNVDSFQGKFTGHFYPSINLLSLHISNTIDT